MKKIIASAGLVAVGAVTLNAQYAPGLTRMEAVKPWSLAASLRGFYDDNYNTAPAHPSSPGIPEAKDSFGIEFSPAVAINLPMEQTFVRAGLIYSMRYFEARKNNNVDNSFEFTGKVEHRFSELYKVRVDDSLVYTQEPEIVEGTVTAPVVRRIKGDVLRNRGLIEFSGQITEEASVVAAYDNIFYDYQEDSIANLLNRVDQRFLLDGRWNLPSELVALAGYNLRLLNYSRDAVLAVGPAGQIVRSDDRNSTTHYMYVGGEKSLSTQLKSTVKVGAEYTAYELNDENIWSPYVDASLTYNYLPGSYLTFGFSYDRNATDVLGPFIASESPPVTLDAQYATLRAQLTHRINPALTGSLLGQYQNANYNGGEFNSNSDNLFLVGINLDYKFTEHWASEIGYNYDKLNSDIPNRGFDRNRVYIGVRASY